MKKRGEAWIRRVVGGGEKRGDLEEREECDFCGNKRVWIAGLKSI